MIDGRTLEHEYDPHGGNFGRAYGTPPKPAGWGGQWFPDPPHPATTGIVPEDVDLTGYTQFSLGGVSEWPLFAADGSMIAARWRCWRREENGHHYCIVFEDFV